MSSQDNKDKNQADTQNTMAEKFAQAVEFCKKNVRYIAAAGLFIVLVIVLAKCSGNSADNAKPKKDAATEVVTEVTETAENYTQDAYPQINELISNYYTAYANGDTDTLATLADPLSDAEKSYIAVFSQYVEGYENISCYTKKGLDDTSYIASVYLEAKFKDVDTTAPGLETFYIRTREDGSLYIDNVYGQFNSQMEEYETDAEVSALLDAFSQQDDVAALQADVQTKYDNALAADENLKNMVEKTIPDAITVWASDQAAAAKKAEEEQKAAEEEQKKAEEEAAKKAAEEQKKAEELAAAVVVYATDKVNVRAEASETADVIGQLEAGSQTTRLEDKDGWSRIDYSNGTQGYVKSEFLSTEAPTAPAADTTTDAAQTTTDTSAIAEGTVIRLTQSTNIRESMSEDAPKVATAFSGEKVTVIMSYAEGWTKVTYGDKTGYIKTELLK